MSAAIPMLHLICGKIASGKSTLTAQLGASAGTIIISEDDWLAALYADEMSSLSDYVRCSARLRDIIGPHVVALLKAGVSVVLDFQANTRASRTWMRGLIDAANVPHTLHYLDVPDAVCKARLHLRNARGDHAFAVTDEQFDQISKHFVAPGQQEGFDIIVHRSDAVQ